MVLLCSAVSVVVVRNPVNSVLLLIFSFFVSAGLFVIMGAEMLAMLMVIVYVGAVAVLFLFVVMMLDVDCSLSKEGFVKHLPIGLFCAVVFFGSLVFIVKTSDSHFAVIRNKTDLSIDNISMIGRVLYTDYIYAFHLSSVLLLIAIIGALVLTMRERIGVKRQKVFEQVNRSSALDCVNTKSGEGIEWKS